MYLFIIAWLLLTRSSCCDALQAESLSPLSLGNMVHGFAALGYQDPRLLACVETWVTQRAGSASPGTAQSLLWSMCILGTRSEAAVRALCARLARLPAASYYPNQLAALFQCHLWLLQHPDAGLRYGKSLTLKFCIKVLKFY